jgi:hypothetical protein
VNFGGSEQSELPADIAAVCRQESVWAQTPTSLWMGVARSLEAPSDLGPNVTVLAERRTDDGPKPRSARRWLAVAAAVAAPVALGAGVGYQVAAKEPPHIAAHEPPRDLAFHLTGTALQPDGAAEGTLRKTPSGLEIVLDVSGLKPAPPDSYYQGWLKSKDRAVTIGTFHARGGGDDIVLWSGVEDTAVFDTVTVTVQRVDGGPASSGRVVLKGSLKPK